MYNFTWRKFNGVCDKKDVVEFLHVKQLPAMYTFLCLYFPIYKRQRGS